MSKRDRGAPQRRFRVMYLLMLQGFIAVMLVVLAFFSANDRRMMLLNLVTLVVPLVWAYALWSAWRRDEAARAADTFDAAFAARERRRGAGLMGGAILVWVALALLVFLFV